jgi:hypothetical protein
LIVQLAASGLPHADPFKSRHSSHAGQKGDIGERQLMAHSGPSAFGHSTDDVQEYGSPVVLS